MRNKRLISLLAIVLLIAASYVLGWSTLFTVSSVEIKGTNAYLPMTVKVGEKLARVEPRAIASAYEKFDFIQDAKVTRNWITGAVTIEITPRTPVAMYNNQAIDKLGKVFSPIGQTPPNLPKIQGVNVGAALDAADFFISLPNEIKSDLVTLKVESAGAYILEVNVAGRSVEVRWGLPTDNALKAKVYMALLAQSENALVKRIDLSAPHAPIVK
jgi:cell division septal protein FtsQ